MLASLAVGIVATGVPLAHNLVTQTRAGVDRPYARPLPRGLRQQVAERVEREGGVRIFSMSQSDPEHGFGAEIVLLTRGPVPAGLVAEVEEMPRAAMGPGMGENSYRRNHQDTLTATGSGSGSGANLA